MNLLDKFYDGANNCRRLLFSSLQSHIKEKGSGYPCDIDDACEFSAGTWERIVQDPSLLTRDQFLDVCFALELDIEDAMPLSVTAKDIADVASLMESNNHGLVAYSGYPIDSSRERESSTTSSHSSEPRSTDVSMSYSDQAQLYIRLKSLDELAQSERR